MDKNVEFRLIMAEVEAINSRLFRFQQRYGIYGKDPHVDLIHILRMSHKIVRFEQVEESLSEDDQNELMNEFLEFSEYLKEKYEP